ncbi:unnamed protein product [Ectocarpus sp. 8 AP-2014]
MFLRNKHMPKYQVADLKGNMDTECFVLAVRRDKPKFQRVKDILHSNSRIKNCTRTRFTDDGLSTIFHPSFEAVAPPEPSSAAPPAGGRGVVLELRTGLKGGDKETV